MHIASHFLHVIGKGADLSLFYTPTLPPTSTMQSDCFGALRMKYARVIGLDSLQVGIAGGDPRFLE